MRLFLILRLVRLLTVAALMSIVLMVMKNEGPPLYDAVTSMVSTGDSLSRYQRKSLLESLPPPVNVTLPTTPKPDISSLVHTFTSIEDEILYIYQKHVMTNWMPRLDRVQRLRREVSRSSNFTTFDQFVLTQHDTMPMPFYSHKLSMTTPLYTPQNDLLKHLPTDPIFAKDTVFNRCSIVGNSGLMVRSACGKEIDSANYVFRCNLVPIKKFGIDAGFKTNLTTMNPSIINTRYHSFRSKASTERFATDLEEYSGHLFLPCLIHANVLKACTTHILPVIQQRNRSAVVTVGNPRHLLGTMKIWKPVGIRYMSTGFYLAQTALTVCNEVHLFGFWPFNRTVYPVPRTLKYHFFDEMAQSRTHKLNTEFQILWQQHNEGILRLHTQDCDDEY